MAAKVFQGGTSGGNWNVNANWVGGAYAVAGDTVTFTGSNPCVVNVNSACASIDFTGWSNTFTINNTFTLTVSGNITLTTGMTFATTTGTLLCAATASLTSKGKAVGSYFAFGGTSQTFTLAGGNNWICGNGITSFGTTPTINTTTTEQLESKVGIANGTTVTGTATMLFSGTGTCTSNGSFSLNMTGNTAGNVMFGNFQYAGSSFATVAGTFSQIAGTTFTLRGSTTLNTPLLTFYNFAYAPLTIIDSTITLNNTLNVSNLFTTQGNLSGKSLIFAGSYGFTIGGFSVINGANLSNLKLNYGNTYTIQNSFQCNGGQLGAGGGGQNNLTVLSSSAGNKVALVLNNGATCYLGYVFFTDVDASGGRTIATFGGTLSNITNIVSFQDLGTVVSGYAS